MTPGSHQILSLLAALSLAPVLGVAWAARRELPPALRFFTGYLALELLVLLPSLAATPVPGPADWLHHLLLPPRTGLLLLTLAAWQAGDRAGRVLRLAGLCHPLLWLPLLLGGGLRESLRLGFDTAQWLLCLAVAAFVLVRRSMEDPEPRVREAWFWIGIGILVLSATRALAAPLSRYFHATEDVGVVLGILILQALAQLLASAFFLQGFRAGRPASALAGLSTAR